MGDSLTVNWRYFSLEQVNSQQGPNWKVWDQPEDQPSRGMLAFRAAEAARRQGEDAFERFHIALLQAKHEERRDIADQGTIIDVAKGVGLDIARFRKDIADRQILKTLASDHISAAKDLHVFGTPTLVFPEKQAFYLKMMPPPSSDDCLNVFNELCDLMKRQNIQEVKRPS